MAEIESHTVNVLLPGIEGMIPRHQRTALVGGDVFAEAVNTAIFAMAMMQHAGLDPATTMVDTRMDSSGNLYLSTRPRA